MLDSLLAFSESRLGPLWGPALYELATSLFFIVCIVVPLMFIPVTLVWLVVIGVRMQTPWSVWK